MKLIITLLVLFSSNEYSQNDSVIKIEYKAATRGALKYISVTENQCYFNLLDKISKYSTKKEDWKIIINSVNQIDLNNIENLEYSSKKSSTDRAMSASIIITFKDKTIKSSFFDDGNPPKELKKIITILFSIATSK